MPGPILQRAWSSLPDAVFKAERHAQFEQTLFFQLIQSACFLLWWFYKLAIWSDLKILSGAVFTVLTINILELVYIILIKNGQFCDQGCSYQF